MHAGYHRLISDTRTRENKGKTGRSTCSQMNNNTPVSPGSRTGVYDQHSSKKAIIKIGPQGPEQRQNLNKVILHRTGQAALPKAESQKKKKNRTTVHVIKWLWLASSQVWQWFDERNLVYLPTGLAVPQPQGWEI